MKISAEASAAWQRRSSPISIVMSAILASASNNQRHGGIAKRVGRMKSGGGSNERISMAAAKNGQPAWRSGSSHRGHQLAKTAARWQRRGNGAALWRRRGALKSKVKYQNLSGGSISVSMVMKISIC